MALTHGLAMKFGARLHSGNLETIPQQDSAALTLSRLQRAFTTQLDALSNMRRGGRQKVVVEHVHIYPGGQAIVGNVAHTRRGERHENEGQPHATDDK
jgi:diadenosine tetraphosphate (Ap4A) HIT family hydrolase